MGKSAICALVSGGLDSCVMLGLLGRKFRKVIPVYVESGLIWERAELYWLKRFLKIYDNHLLQRLTVLKVPALPTYKEHWSITGRHMPGANSRDRSVYLPGRNIMLLSQTAVLCAQKNIHTIAIGILEGNPFPDSTTKFFNYLSRALSSGLNFKINIIAPFSGMTKSEVIAAGRNLPLELTFSCISPAGLKPCNNCNKCTERMKGNNATGF